MEAFHKRTFNGWEAIDDQGQKILKRFKVGDLAMIKITRSRNIKFHRKFFAVINLTYENQDFARTTDDFREAVTIEAGYYHYQKQIDGTETKRADTISFAGMDDITFGDLYNKAFDVCLHVLGCKSEELELELLKLA